MWFPPHLTIHGPSAIRPTPPTANDLADVPLTQFQAAKAILGATHLSSDGARVYLQKMGELRVCYWNEEMKCYDSSFPCQDLPGDAVKIE